jgi:3-ketosteroid 9alpha-monooxygenase subunit A
MLVRRIPGISDEQNAQIASTYIQYIQQGFYQDVAIWDNKVRIDNPLLCEGDGPISHLRRWYQQFYLDEAEVPPAAREHRVVELNPGNLSTIPPLHHVFER